tara:strand:- start:301 stop:1659 length:1359 start_codon:yes stop_codon:yes gene_type:complete
MSLINIFYSFYFDYLTNLKSYITVLLFSLTVGFLLFYFGKKNKTNINVYEQLILIFLIYFLISAFFCIPFYLSSYNIPLIDSYFESISGLTGTGFTIFDEVKRIDEPLLLWRSSSQWLGGFYFLIFLVLVFSNKQINFKFLDFTYNLENKINFSPNLLSVTSRIFFIYLLLTFFVFFIFLLSGMRLFTSLNMTMTVISSGGFIPSNSLDEIVKNNIQYSALCLSFLISILNFYIFYNIFFGRDKFKEHTEDLYIFIIIIIFSTIFYFFNDFDLISVLASVLSSLSTSGIGTVSVPSNFGLYFIVLTLIGGSVLSTSSGLKFIRIYILFKAFLMEIYKSVKPNVVLNTKIMFTEKKINSENIKISFLIFILFFFSLFILSSILLTDFLNFENSFKLSILTLTNTVSSNIYGMDKIEFQNLFTFSKISLIMFMIIAKVEMLTVFLLFRKLFLKN